jgi:putative FmdB family regulatory protein
MPTYDYLCSECGKTYDVFHKVREVEQDIVCPSCQSTRHQRLLSAPSVSMAGRTPSEIPSCTTGGCCGGGMCDVN